MSVACLYKSCVIYVIVRVWVVYMTYSVDGRVCLYCGYSICDVYFCAICLYGMSVYVAHWGIHLVFKLYACVHVNYMYAVFVRSEL